MALIDTHCHYNLEPLWANWQTHWIKAQAAGIKIGLVVGADQLSCQRGLEISATTPNLLPTIGFHPEVYDLRTQQLFDEGKSSTQILIESQQQIDQDIIWLKSQAQQAKIIAIGETGLDYYYFNPAQTDLNQLKTQVQQIAFQAQIKLANDLNLPLIVHTRDKSELAYRDALKLIKLSYHFAKPFVLHCVSGPLDYIAEAIDLGGYIGFDGNLTYKKNQNLIEIFKSVPANRILLETDAPFLPPQNFRGQTCEPWMVNLTADYIETVLGLPKTQLTLNAVTCFDLSPSAMG